MLIFFLVQYLLVTYFKIITPQILLRIVIYSLVLLNIKPTNMKPIDIEQEKKLTSWKNCHHCPALFFMCHPLTTLCDLSSTLLPPPRPHAVLRTLKNSMSKTSSDAFSSALYLWSTWYIEHRLLLNKLLLKIEASSFGLPDIALSWFPHSLTWALLCNFPCFSLHFIFFFNFYFVLEHSGLIMLQKFQVNNKGTQPYIYM